MISNSTGKKHDIQHQVFSGLCGCAWCVVCKQLVKVCTNSSCEGRELLLNSDLINQLKLAPVTPTVQTEVQ